MDLFKVYGWKSCMDEKEKWFDEEGERGLRIFCVIWVVVLAILSKWMLSSFVRWEGREVDGRRGYGVGLRVVYVDFFWGFFFLVFESRVFVIWFLF